MIYTVTCNPAIDKTLRETETVFDVGGKGINVSKVLNSLKVKSICLGFVGKDNKQVVYDYLDSLEIEHDFVEIEGSVRVNTKQIIDGQLVEHNQKGPEGDEDSFKALCDKLQTLNGQIVVISGSAPKNVPDDYYETLVKVLKENNNYVILDCDKQLLKNAVKAKPHVIKPNIEELERLFDMKFDSDEKIIEKVKELGIELVIVSMGSKGALFVGEKTYRVNAPKVNFVSPLGAGDSMVAAVALSKNTKCSYEQLVLNAMAFASAQTETEGSKPAKRERIEYFKENISLDQDR